MEFVEAPLFTKLVRTYLDDEGYRLLQLTMAQNPEVGSVMQATGGFRKMRWRDPRRGEGKRGGLRVVYYYFPQEEQVWLLTLYDKGEVQDLSAAEKRMLRTAIEHEKQARRGGGRRRT